MIDFNRKLARNIDVSVLLIALLLAGIGLVAIASVTMHIVGTAYLKTQVTAMVLGILIIVGVLLIDYRWYKEYAGMMYAGVLVTLSFTLIYGRIVSGAKSWIRLGGANIQPSELAKLVIILVLAAYISEREEEMKYFWGMVKTSLIAGGPVLLILAQNDLGTALVFIGILLGMLYVGGGNRLAISLVVIVSVLLVMTLVIVSMYTAIDLPFLKSYQLKRLQVLIDPYIDPHGYGWNIIQSEVAIGSGQLMGKGFAKGTQNMLSFLPERHTDFIFPVIGEEFGFLGTMTVLILYLFLLLRCIIIARNTRDKFGTLVVVGVTSMWLFHILENIGMTIGLMPITGIPLPFISYGGSSMLTNMIAVGLIMNVRMRKKKILF